MPAPSARKVGRIPPVTSADRESRSTLAGFLPWGRRYRAPLIAGKRILLFLRVANLFGRGGLDVQFFLPEPQHQCVVPSLQEFEFMP